MFSFPSTEGSASWFKRLFHPKILLSMFKVNADRGRERYRKASITASASLIQKALTIVISFASVPLTVHYLFDGAARTITIPAHSESVALPSPAGVATIARDPLRADRFSLAQGVDRRSVDAHGLEPGGVRLRLRHTRHSNHA